MFQAKQPPKWMIPLAVADNLATSAVRLTNQDAPEYLKMVNKHDEVIRCVEIAMCFLHNVRNARTKTCVFVACCSFYSSVTGRSASGSVLRIFQAAANELTDDLPFWQSGSNWIDICDSLYSNVNRVRKSVLGNKIVKVFNHVLAHAVYAKMGIEVDEKLFKQFEEKRMRPTFWQCATFADSLVALLLFLAKAGRQAMLTGSIEAFFIDDVVVTKWLDEAAAIRKDSEFINNPTAIGITLASYVAKLDACLDTGNELLKVFKTGQQHSILHSVTLELRLIKNRYTTSLSAASFRRAPVGVFLFGDAGVAKSFLAAGLFNHYCSVRGIDKENAQCWTRDDNDPFYSGYKSHFAGVLYDDAAKFRSNKVQGVDPSIKDIISAINNIPFITNQAELADKGKIPFLSEWVGVTSNLGDLNADQYYNCSAAFLRRLQVRIQPIVKEEFCIPGETRIDATKIPPNQQYPDLWTFVVAKPKLLDAGKGIFEEVKVCGSYSELLAYMSPIYEEHIANQDKLMATVGNIGPEPLCDCRLPISICQCSTGEGTMLFGDVCVPVQSRTIGEEPSDESVAWLTQWVTLRRRLKKELASTSVEMAYYEQLWDEPSVSGLLSPEHDRDEGSFSALESDVRESMKSFKAMTPRERLDVLTDDAFTAAAADAPDEDYLDFTPTKGKPCFFLQHQLAQLRSNILQYVVIDVDAHEQAVLDDFLYHKAPVCVAEGWPMRDIIKAANCYVSHYGPKVRDATLLQAKDLLDHDESTAARTVMVWLATQYFERPWVHATCNYLSGFRAIRWLARNMAHRAVNDAARMHIIHTGAKYDTALGGKSIFVVLLVAVCTTGALVMAAFGMYRMFASKDSVESCEAPSDDIVEVTDDVSAQANLDAIGRKPVARETEKANVWTVKERSITRLDVDPRRPHTLDQAVNAIKTNLLYAETRVTHDGRLGTACTRLLVIDNDTLLMNNHFVPERGTIEVWLGPKTSEGLQPSVKFDVTEDMCSRDLGRDLCFVSTKAMPRRFRDIRHLFPRPNYQSVGNAFYVKKLENGEIDIMPCTGVHMKSLRGMVGAPDVCMEAWAVTPATPTDYGDCGSVLMIQSPLGCVAVGIHCGYSSPQNLAYSIPVYSADMTVGEMVTVGSLRPHGTVAQVRTSFCDLMPRDKLYTDYHKEGHLMVHGQLKGFIPRTKFSGKKTAIATEVLSHGTNFSPQITDRMAAPVAHPWQQAQMVLTNYLQPTHSIDETMLRVCAEAMADYFSDGLTDVDWSDIHPVPIDVAVNGFPGVPNVDAQKVTTSGGHGFRGPKLQYLSDATEHEEWSHYRRYDDVVISEVERIVDDAKLGIRPHAVYTGSMKDEMLSKAKVAAGKARVVYMCPVDFLTAMRMFTLGLTRVMVRRRDLFGIAVGLNTHSEEWNDCFETANELPGDNWIAGDFKAFESVLSILLSNYASYVFMELCRNSGNFDKSELLALETLLADTTNPTIDFFGTLITLLGGEVSGHQLTTHFNCICNQLLHMYAYVSTRAGSDDPNVMRECALEFFEYVRRNTLGDDVYLKVHPDAPEYNHTSIQKVFRDIGITYTMADKEADSVPYISWQEVSFLKRKFVDHECFPGLKVAALDKESIYKMLLYTIPSKSSSEEEQLASACASAQAEAFFHGREFFGKISSLISGLHLSEEQAFRFREMPRPSWSAMIKRFVDASPKLQAKQLVPGIVAETTQTGSSNCHDEEVVLQTSWRMDCWGSTTMECSSEERFDVGVRLSPKRARKPRKSEEAPSADNTILSKQFSTTKENHSGHKEMALPAAEKAINKLNNKKRQKTKRKSWENRVVTQSGVVYDAANPSMNGGVSTDVIQETTVFKNEPESVHVDLPAWSNGLASSMNMQQDLAKYLSRPRLIHSYVWPENSSNGVKSSFTPWAGFFNDANMAAKLRGYSLLRANLKLKFLVNGSPFYYGSMLAAYTPLTGWRADTAAGSVNLLLVANSQKPHVWLENQNMSTAEMELPFLFPYPYMDITELDNLTGMGKVELIQYVPLLSANGTSTSNIDVQVYAWAEDVMLSGPTDRPILQSGFKPDGQVSSIASAVASAAGKLTKVPLLGPYAMATQMASTAISDVASYFGFTNVPNIADVAPMKQMPFQLASTAISEPVHKLSLQPKQETAIGSKQHGGLGEDDLTISRFVGRTSFVVGSEWTTTLTPGTPIFTTAVTPATFQTGLNQLGHTPLSYAANHFQYWRGTIKYTFKLVRSPYHRGRLQISWDRGTADLSLGPTVGNPNTYTTIMDLDEESECSFEVPYMQPPQFLAMPSIDKNLAAPWSTSSTPTGFVPSANGVLSVRVVNRLTAPEASSSATLLVFISGCEDMQLAAPREFPLISGNEYMGLSSATTAVTQSKVAYDDDGQAHSFTGSTNESDLYKEVFGEKVTSFREYLHRSSVSLRYVSAIGASAEGLVRSIVPLKRIPLPPGVYANGWWTGTTTSGAGQRVNYSKFHPILTLGSCFIGYKGSVNITANVDQNILNSEVDTLQIQRISGASVLGAGERRARNTFAYSTASSQSVQVSGMNSSMSSGVTGMALTNTRTNTGLSVALPYYSNTAFQLMNPANEYNNQDTFTNANSDWWELEWRENKPVTSGNTLSSVTVWYSTGPDFDFVFFVNVPILSNVAITAV
nr:polyprotein [Mute swan feces associated picorna-like virus 8]